MMIGQQRVGPEELRTLGEQHLIGAIEAG